MGGSSSKKGDKQIGVVVAKVDDLEDGQMKEVDVATGKALLIRENGQFYAVSPKCTHFGAPLVKGALCNGRLRCQWHGACFNIRTGDIEDFPGLDSLQTYKVEVKDGNVSVFASGDALASTKRVKDMCCALPEDERLFLIIGGGGAAASCVETLRQEGFKGRIVMATKESCLPYDRTKLSKILDAKPDAIALRNAEMYSVYDIEVQTNKEASNVDPVLKNVSFTDGSTITYDKLLIATGGSPRQLTIPGHDLNNVCLLRTPDDANHIAKLVSKKHVVIIGSSFIGLELAAYAQGKATSVTVIGRGDVPFLKVFGERVGNMFKQMHEEKGTKFISDNPPKELTGDGAVKEIVLEDGTKLPADVVVVGVGVKPSTQFLDGSGIELTDAGYVKVDKFMKTSKDGIYAAGDIVEFPLFLRDGAPVNIQHWQMACKHGNTAGLNMTDQATEIKSVPYFWTMQFGKSIRYAGYGAGFDDIVLHGDPADQKFIAYYTKDTGVVAVATMNFDPIASQVAEMMFSGNKILKDEIQSSPDGWLSRLNT